MSKHEKYLIFCTVSDDTVSQLELKLVTSEILCDL